MLAFAITLGFALVSIASLFCLVRLIQGPSIPDRILALDTLYVNTIALLVLFGMQQGNTLYFEAALFIAVLGFISTIALSKYVLRGNIME